MAAPASLPSSGRGCRHPLQSAYLAHGRLHTAPPHLTSSVHIVQVLAMDYCSFPL